MKSSLRALVWTLLLPVLLASCGAPAPAGTQPASEDPQHTAAGAPAAASAHPRTDRVGEMAAVYPDTVGWLLVPGTDIDSGVVQHQDVTNEYYLNHDLDGNPDRNGVYSAHSGCRLRPGARGELSRNTTLFAHNHDDDPDGILFAQLKRFLQPDFAAENRYLYFSTAREDMVWEIFAVFHAKKDLPYIKPDQPWHVFAPVVDTALSASLYDYGITPGREDKLLTLSTCTFTAPGVEPMPLTEQNEYRFVVMARLLEPGAPVGGGAPLPANTGPLPPDDIPDLGYDRDILQVAGREFRLDLDHLTDSLAAPVDYSRLVEVGRVARTGAAAPDRDWEASTLPVGTPVSHDPDYPDLLLAEVDGEWLAYAPGWDDRQWLSHQLVLMEGEQELARRELYPEGDEALEAAYDSLSDMTGALHLGRPDQVTVEDSGGRRVLSVQRDTVTTWTFVYRLGTPETVGEECMLKYQVDGVYARDASLFHQLAALLMEEPDNP